MRSLTSHALIDGPGCATIEGLTDSLTEQTCLMNQRQQLLQLELVHALPKEFPISPISMNNLSDTNIEPNKSRVKDAFSRYTHHRFTVQP